MKRWIPVLALALCLAGCAGRTEPAASPEATAVPPSAQASAAVTAPVPTSTPAATPEPPPSDTPASEPSSTPEAQQTQQPTQDPAPTPDGPTDEEVLEAYSRAEEAWNWFTIAPPALDHTDTLEQDGRSYCRVNDPRFSTLVDLRGYLKGLFSDSLVEELLPIDGVQFIEADGALYAVDGGRGADLTKGAETVQILRAEDGAGRITVRVTVEILDPEAEDHAVTGEETFDFTYEQVGGKWIFTTFSAVR